MRVGGCRESGGEVEGDSGMGRGAGGGWECDGWLVHGAWGGVETGPGSRQEAGGAAGTWGWGIFGAGMGGDTVSRQAAGAGPEVERATRRGGDPRVGDFPPAVSFSKVMRVARYGDPAVRFGNPNLRWGSPSYILEPGDPGYVPPATPNPLPNKPKTNKRNYMASNETPNRFDELVAAGEDLCDGLDQHAVTAGIKQNTAAEVRGELDALTGAHGLFKEEEGRQPAAYTALRVADSNAKGFIAAAIKVLSITLGDDWSDAWQATGLPDNRVGVPRTQDARFTALGGLKVYFTNHPAQEVSTAAVVVTAARATTLHTALSTADFPPSKTTFA